VKRTKKGRSKKQSYKEIEDDRKEKGTWHVQIIVFSL